MQEFIKFAKNASPLVLILAVLGYFMKLGIDRN